MMAALAFLTSKLVNEVVPIHIEVLLPGFVPGCMIARPKMAKRAEAADRANATHGRHDILETPVEKRAATTISAILMVLVGLSMPAIAGMAGGRDCDWAARRGRCGRIDHRAIKWNRRADDDDRDVLAGTEPAAGWRIHRCCEAVDFHRRATGSAGWNSRDGVMVGAA